MAAAIQPYYSLLEGEKKLRRLFLELNGLPLLALLDFLGSFILQKKTGLVEFLAAFESWKGSLKVNFMDPYCPETGSESEHLTSILFEILDKCSGLTEGERENAVLSKVRYGKNGKIEKLVPP